MAFSVAARVKVTDQHSEFRGKLGTVEAVTGDSHSVRLDGFQVGQTELLRTDQLSTTTLASEIDYSHAS